jgi:beta-glucosidase-like glycosyl hydrolase
MFWRPGSSRNCHSLAIPGQFIPRGARGRGARPVTRNRGRRARRRSPARAIVVTVIGCAVAGTLAIASARTAIRGDAPPEAAAAPVVTGNTRVDGLLARMSLADKLRLLEWVPVRAPGRPVSAVLPGLPRLGIPPLRLTGLPGGAPASPPPGMISPLGVAATFNTQDAFVNGMVTGRDARARGDQVVAGPFTSIGAAAPAGPGGPRPGAAGSGDRGAGGPGSGGPASGGVDSGWGGMTATFGEDPLLAGQAAAAEVAGIQGQGTMAMAVTGPDGPGGRYGSGAAPGGSAGGGAEAGGAGAGGAGVGGTAGSGPARSGPAGSSRDAAGGGQAISPAALHEIYLPPLEDAVRVGLAGVMCAPLTPSFPGGGPGCGSTGTLSHLLRGELGFRGFLLSAPGAAATARSLSSGLDGEVLPGPAHTSPGPARAVPGSASTAPGPASATSGSASTGPASTATPDAGPTPESASPTHRAASPTPGHARTTSRQASPGQASPSRAQTGQARGGPGQVPADVQRAIANGTLRLATVNRAVGALLAQMSRFGLLGAPAARSATRVPAAADERVAQQTARDAATLLKNGRHALPLSGRELGSLVLIGPGTGQTGPGEPTATPPGGQPPGGRTVYPRQPSLYQALRARLAHVPAAHLTYVAGSGLAGTPVPATVLTHHGRPGLVRVTTESGSAAVVQSVNNTAASGYPLPAGSGHTWTGDLTAPVSGTYTISLRVQGATASAAIDGTTVARTGPASRDGTGSRGGTASPSGNVTLTAGPHSLAVTQAPDGSGSQVQISLDWLTPGQQQAASGAARAAAANAAAAVVLAGGGTDSGTLPAGQDRLIAQVAAANPDTIVVLNTPGPVAMPWLRDVAAVLEMWDPGGTSGAPAADVLLGRAGPAGRLPFTWPVPSQRQPPPGPAPGYRWFDEHRLAPLFPFGYGLSYTRFSYSRLGWSASPGNGLTLQFDITNTGRMAGEAVPQVYLGVPARAGRAEYAPRSLAAYTRVGLRPGQSETVTLRVPPRQLQYWDDAVGWVTEAGRRPVYIGPDERTDALTATVTIPG